MQTHVKLSRFVRSSKFFKQIVTTNCVANENYRDELLVKDFT